ncbi:hypothetical protein ElyMa_003419500 [Elysia marginata]|uniref:Uncharacterized protein n=1 Tax=Elysia marginata TaxID=1093978 RepID=A0AAV4JSV7_9GAST|nr:hypothetical protein ElyMa_003419500 [Elysia marginata]
MGRQDIKTGPNGFGFPTSQGWRSPGLVNTVLCSSDTFIMAQGDQEVCDSMSDGVCVWGGVLLWGLRCLFTASDLVTIISSQHTPSPDTVGRHAVRPITLAQKDPLLVC